MLVQSSMPLLLSIIKPLCCCREQNVMQLWKDYPRVFLTIYMQVIKKCSAKFSHSLVHQILFPLLAFLFSTI
jgi:hypothetical protein